MLEGDFRAIPGLYLDFDLLVCDPPCVGIRLKFDCTPKEFRSACPSTERKSR
jgi:predicted ester cyclase